MKHSATWFALLIPGCVPGAWAEQVLYNNTATDTGDTVFYDVGSYSALGDQITLLSPGTASQAIVEMYNNGDAGTFDAQLNFFSAGSPAGTLIGSSTLTGVTSAGLDVIDMTFDLTGGLLVPQALIFTVNVSNESPGMELGLDMYEPPTVGSSDNSFMIAESMGVYSQLNTNSENVYFRLSGTDVAAAPEPSSRALLAAGLLLTGLAVSARKRFRDPRRERQDTHPRR